MSHFLNSVGSTSSTSTSPWTYTALRRPRRPSFNLKNQSELFVELGADESSSPMDYFLHDKDSAGHGGTALKTSTGSTSVYWEALDLWTNQCTSEDAIFGGVDDLLALIGDDDDVPTPAPTVVPDPDPISFLDGWDMEGVKGEDDAFSGWDPDAIKTDLLWSSAQDLNLTNKVSDDVSRRRDVSPANEVTDVLWSAVREGSLCSDAGEGDAFTPVTVGNTLDTPALSSESDYSSSSSQDSDYGEEVDVMTSGCRGSELSSSRTRPRSLLSHPPPPPPPVIEAGRSLLKRHPPGSGNVNSSPKLKKAHRRNKRPEIATSSSPVVIDHVQGDHSYFLVRAPPNLDERANLPNIGLLTPTESSDEEFNGASPTIMTVCNAVDKRKIARAVQNLMRNNNGGGMETLESSIAKDDKLSQRDVKFRFRMRFKSSSSPGGNIAPGRSLLSIKNNEGDTRTTTTTATSRKRCAVDATPSSLLPKATSTPVTKVSSSLSPVKKVNTPPASSVLANTGRRLSSSSVKAVGNEFSLEKRCREIRDLHNSMERQRRIDLKNNFDRLKVKVPCLDGMEKASKLVILNKATEYCHILSSHGARMAKAKEREIIKKEQLLEQLSQLIQKYDCGTRLSSGRFSIPKKREI